MLLWNILNKDEYNQVFKKLNEYLADFKVKYVTKSFLILYLFETTKNALFFIKYYGNLHCVRNEH